MLTIFYRKEVHRLVHSAVPPKIHSGGFTLDSLRLLAEVAVPRHLTPTEQRPARPRAHISLSWLSQSFLSLILLAISLAVLLANIGNLVSDAKESYTAACQGVQGAANVLVSLPHYTADGINELNSKSVTAVTHGAADVLDIALLSVESIAIFIVDMYKSLYLCLLDLAVHGSLDLLISAIQDAESFITGAFQDVRTEVQDAVGGINTAIKDAVDVVNKIPGVDIKPPTIDVPALTSLENVTIPSTLVSSLEKLNSTIPTLDSLRASLDSFISTPIEELRTLVNTTLSNATIDIELLPVPAKSSIDLCSSLDTGFIDDVGRDMAKFIKIGLGLLGVAAALLILFNALWERYRYRVFLEGVGRARQAWQLDMGGNPKSVEETLSTSNLLSFISASHHPTISLVLARLANWFRLTPDRRAALYWFGAYIFHPTALLFLFLGVFGLVTTQLQLALLEGPVKSAVQDRANSGAGDVSASVLAKINENLNSSSVEFATASNAVINKLQNGINDDLFGWVNTTTTAMNGTLNAFYDGLTSTISDFFAGTPFKDIALDFVYCLIGSKVTSFEKGLTFIHDNAHITLPTVSNSVLLLSPNRTSELTSDMTSPNSTVSTTSIVNRIVDRYAESLRQQRLAFIICLAVWGLVLVMGLIGVFWKLRGRELWLHHRGQKGPRSPPSFKDEKRGLRSFKLQSNSPSPPPCLPPSNPFSPAPASPPAHPFPNAPPVSIPVNRGIGVGSTWNSFSNLFHRPTAPKLALPNISTRLTNFPKISRPTLATFPPSHRQRDILEPDYFARRSSDGVGLRTGLYLDRPLPPQPRASGRFKGVVSAVTNAARSKGVKKGTLGRNGSLTSLGPRREDEWDHGDDCEEEEGEELWEGLQEMMLSPRPFERFSFSEVATQQPLSPPPVALSHPTEFSNPPTLAAFLPLVPMPAPPRRQPASYQPTSGPAISINPFQTPFDGENE